MSNSGGVWGRHLNKAKEKVISSSCGPPSTVDLAFSNWSDTFPDSCSRSKSSHLKRNGRSKFSQKPASQSFFDTLGSADFSLDSSSTATKESLPDPLAKFDPEISLQGQSDSKDVSCMGELSFFGKLSSFNLESAVTMETQVQHRPQRRPLASMTSFASKPLPTAESPRTAFSGLFSKSDPDKNVQPPSGVKETQSFSCLNLDDDDSAGLDKGPPRLEKEDESNSKSKRKLEFGGTDGKSQEGTNIFSLGFEDPEDECASFPSAKRFKLAPKSSAALPIGNFVKINLKKKTYVRKKNTMTGAKFRRMEWKRKTAEKQKAARKTPLVDPELAHQDQPEDLALHDAIKQMEEDVQFNEVETLSHTNFTIPLQPFKESMSCTNDYIITALGKFGFDSFRSGQEEAIRRILNGDSTLVVSATGSGKSLIYQLPAYLYCQQSNCITLVVSPLVSLMEDQIQGLPSFIKASCLHHGLTEKQKDKVLDDLGRGKLHFLLLSPETIAGGGALFGKVLKKLPSIAMVCIDEAHCVSQWSHNFRPAYLQLAKVVREKLGVRTILALTATASEATLEDVAERLGICPKTGIVRGPLLPDNITLSVSKENDRDIGLVSLLKSQPFAGYKSIIVYCTRREECTKVANLIRTCFKDSEHIDKSGRSRTSAMAEAFHAGLTVHRRKTIQNQFMSGKLRIVVATIAFGMGIDKSDLRGIIHFDMPKTFESYVQEIGRAGRDGLPARCHLFLDCNKTESLNELRRYIHANSVDRHVIRKLVSTVFAVGAADKHQATDYVEAAIPVANLVSQLDMKEENIATLLCYLDSHPKKWLQILNPTYSKCTIHSYRTDLRQLARDNVILSDALQQEPNANRSLSFDVIQIAAKRGWASSSVKQELKSLQWERVANGRFQRSGVTVELSELSFHFKVRNGLSEEEVELILDFLYDKIAKREKGELINLNRAYRSFMSVAFDREQDCGSAHNDEVMARSHKLKGFIRDYFSESAADQDHQASTATISSSSLSANAEDSLRAEVRHFITTYTEHAWTGRAVARIFHGIQSPNFSAEQWARVRRFWRCRLDIDFYTVMKIATQEIVKLRVG